MRANVVQRARMRIRSQRMPAAGHRSDAGEILRADPHHAPLDAVRHVLGIHVDRAAVIARGRADDQVAVVEPPEIIGRIAEIVGLGSHQHAVTVVQRHRLSPAAHDEENQRCGSVGQANRSAVPDRSGPEA